MRYGRILVLNPLFLSLTISKKLQQFYLGIDPRQSSKTVPVRTDPRVAQTMELSLDKGHTYTIKHMKPVYNINCATNQWAKKSHITSLFSLIACGIAASNSKSLLMCWTTISRQFSRRHYNFYENIRYILIQEVIWKMFLMNNKIMIIRTKRVFSIFIV